MDLKYQINNTMDDVKVNGASNYFSADTSVQILTAPNSIGTIAMDENETIKVDEYIRKTDYLSE